MRGDAFVYILECADGKYYVGSYRGLDLESRVGEHNSGQLSDAWTFRRRPVQLVWSAHFYRKDEALAFEQQIKKWSRAKKEALIRGDIPELKRLAISKSAPADPSKAAFPRHQQ